MYFDATGIPCVLPSPNIPTLDTAIVYPGTVLFEGTNVSEGRGTTGRSSCSARRGWTPSASPTAMNALALPGVLFRPARLRADVPQARAAPAAAAARSTCSIAQTFRPVETGVALIAAFRAADPDRFRWRDPPYEYEHEKLPIDILAGSSALREQIEAGVPARDIARVVGTGRSPRSSTLRESLPALLNHVTAIAG